MLKFKHEEKINNSITLQEVLKPLSQFKIVIYVLSFLCVVAYSKSGKFSMMIANSYVNDKNYADAVKWYERAAYKGLTEAQVMAGNLYYDGGYGLTRDYKKADMWYRVALEGQFSSRSVWDRMYEIANGIYITDPNDPLDVSLALLELSWNFISDEWKMISPQNIYDRIRSIEGEGLFNLADISYSEIEEAKADSLRIILSIIRR